MPHSRNRHRKTYGKDLGKVVGDVKDPPIVTALYAAVAISPIWLLLGKLTAVRGTACLPLHALVQVRAASKFVEDDELTPCYDKASIAPLKHQEGDVKSIEKDIFKLILDMSVAGFKAYRDGMPVLVRKWKSEIRQKGLRPSLMFDNVGEIAQPDAETFSMFSSEATIGKGYDGPKKEAAGRSSSKRLTKRLEDEIRGARKKKMLEECNAFVEKEKENPEWSNTYGLIHGLARYLCRTVGERSRASLETGFDFKNDGGTTTWWKVAQSTMLGTRKRKRKEESKYEDASESSETKDGKGMATSGSKKPKIHHLTYPHFSGPVNNSRKPISSTTGCASHGSSTTLVEVGDGIDAPVVDHDESRTSTAASSEMANTFLTDDALCMSEQVSECTLVCEKRVKCMTGNHFDRRNIIQAERTLGVGDGVLRISRDLWGVVFQEQTMGQIRKSLGKYSGKVCASERR